MEFSVILTGFKSKEEAMAWISAYSGGVEQDMSTWAEKPTSQGGGYSFPFNCRYHQRTETDNSIALPLTHPDSYKIAKEREYEDTPDSIKEAILLRDPGATFEERGIINSCLDYGVLQDIIAHNS